MYIVQLFSIITYIHIWINTETSYDRKSCVNLNYITHPDTDTDLTKQIKTYFNRKIHVVHPAYRQLDMKIE